MSDPFIGEVRAFGYTNLVVQNWAKCDGTIMSATDNGALFSLLGPLFGGDGQSTFGIPDLRGRSPIGIGRVAAGLPNRTNGDKGGFEEVALTEDSMPAHRHQILATDADATDASPSGNYFATENGNDFAYHDDSGSVVVVKDMLSSAGGGMAHNNLQPSIGLWFLISLQGYYPLRD